MLDSRSLSVFTRMARARAPTFETRAVVGRLGRGRDVVVVVARGTGRANGAARTPGDGTARVRRANELGDATRVVDMAGRRRRANRQKVTRRRTSREGRRRGETRERCARTRGGRRAVRLRARRDEDDDEGGETRRRDDGGVGGVDAFFAITNGSVVTWTRAGGRARARAVRERRVAFAARGGGAEGRWWTGGGDGFGGRCRPAPLRWTIPEVV